MIWSSAAPASEEPHDHPTIEQAHAAADQLDHNARHILTYLAIHDGHTLQCSWVDQ